MMINVIVKESKKLLVFNEQCNGIDEAGVIGDHNAEILHFILPDKINNQSLARYIKRAWFVTTEGKTAKTIDSDGNVKIENYITSAGKATLFVEITNPSDLPDFIWRSKPHDLTFAYVPADAPPMPGEAVRSELTESLRLSMTENLGYDYTGDTWEELVGVYEEFESGGSIVVPDEDEGGDVPPSAPVYHYQHGALWQLRTALKGLYDYITPFLHTTSVSAPPACYASIESIKSDIDYIKDSIVTAINETLNPEEPITIDSSWYDIVASIRELPSEVGTIITQSVGDSSDGLREDVDRVINQIITEYDLSMVTVTGTWDATLNNLVAVCDSISEIYEGRIESIEDNIDTLSLSIEAVTGVRPSNFLEFKNLIEEFNPSLREAIEAATGDIVDEGLLYEDLVNLVKNMQTGGEVTPQSVYIPFSFTEEDGEKTDLAFVTDEDGLPCIITGETEE